MAAQGSGEQAVIVVSVPGVDRGRPGRASWSDRELGVPSGPGRAAERSPDSHTHSEHHGQARHERTTRRTPRTTQGGGNGGLVPQLSPDASTASAVTGKNDNQNQSDKPTAQPTDAPIQTPAPVAPGAADVSPELQQQYAELDCSDPEQADVGADFTDNEPAIACDRNGLEKFLLAPVAVAGTDVDSAAANLQQNTAGWVVSLDFNGDGTKTFGEITAEMALADARLTSKPLCHRAGRGRGLGSRRQRGRFSGGQAEISGQFTQAEAPTWPTC